MIKGHMYQKQKKKIRVAILTQPLHVNYGGLLQAFALSRVLQSLGCETTVVNRIKRPTESLSRKIKNGIKKYFVCKYIDILAPVLFCKPDLQTLSRHTRKFIEKHIPSSCDLISTSELRNFCNGNFDAYVVGSDQVWRPRYSPCITNYFLDFLHDNSKVRKVSYAASFGVATWEYTPSQTSKCKLLVKQFDALSVREDSAVGLCKEYLGVAAQHVLDPTLLLTKDEYIQILNLNKKSSGDLFTYMLDRSDSKQTVINKIEKVLGLTSFEVYAKALSSQERNNIMEYIVPPVEDCLLAFHNANYIITDSFHGCVFSIIFEKPFLVIGNHSRGFARFDSLLSLFELEDRLIKNIEDLTEQKINKTIDWSRVGVLLDEKRQESLDFLTASLNIK